MKKAVCVYGASSSRIDAVFTEAAFELGALIARAGRPLVCGGGRGGLMAAAIEGAASVGGETIGVLPQFMVDREWQHPSLSRMIVTPDMHTRKRTMLELSCAAIALPGGCGTFEELTEAITWRQLGLFKGPVVIADIDGYYASLLAMFDTASRRGFMRPSSVGHLWQAATTPAEALALALATQTETEL